jgi:hypothetical protein
MTDSPARDPASERVAETVRRALSLVGPAENGLERIVEEPAAVEEPAV